MPRWRPHFSLRTLLLATLLCGSGALLWQHKGPWEPAISTPVDDEIYSCSFSPDSKWILLQSMNKKPLDSERNAKLYNANTGALKQAYSTKASIKFSPSGRYTYSDYDLYNVQKIQETSVIEIETGRSLQYASPSEEQCTGIQFDASDSTVVLKTTSSALLFKLPEFKLLARFDHTTDLFVTADLQHVAQIIERKVRIFSFASMKIEHEWTLPCGHAMTVKISPTGRRLAIFGCVQGITICDSLTGTELFKKSADDVSIYPEQFQWATDNIFLACDNVVDLEPKPHVMAVVPKLAKPDLFLYRGPLIAKISSSQIHFYNKQIRIGDTYIPGEPSIMELPSGKIVWNGDESIHFSENRDFAVRVRDTVGSRKMDVVSTENSSELFTLPANHFGQSVRYFRWIFNANKPEFVTYFTSRDQRFAFAGDDVLDEREVKSSAADDETNPNQFLPPNQCTVWRQSRPFAWYGYAWLWEFWLFILLLGACVWSLFQPFSQKNHSARIANIV